MNEESENEQLERYIRKLVRDEVAKEEIGKEEVKIVEEKGIDILNLPRTVKRVTLILDGEGEHG